MYFNSQQLVIIIGCLHTNIIHKYIYSCYNINDNLFLILNLHSFLSVICSYNPLVMLCFQIENIQHNHNSTALHNILFYGAGV